MLLSVLDLPSRIDEARDRFREARSTWAVWAVLVIACVAFLIVETVWKTMTSPSTPARDQERAGTSTRAADQPER